MRKAKEIDGYRQKYAFGYDTGQTSATESDCDDDSGNFDVYESK